MQLVRLFKRLIRNNHIESYKIKSNKKEIYFKLTPKGQQIFSEHDKMHSKVYEIDSEFLNQVDERLLESFNQVLTDYNEFLSKHTEILKNQQSL